MTDGGRSLDDRAPDGVRSLREQAMGSAGSAGLCSDGVGGPGGLAGGAGCGDQSMAAGAVGHDSAGGVVTRPARSILALDPGTTETGWVIYDGKRVIDSGVQPNEEILTALRLSDKARKERQPITADGLAIEMIASYGMPVGREVFETCVWIGRFVQAWHDPEAVRLVYRRDVKLHLCGTSKAKDPNVRQALIDLFPATGGGKTPQIGTKGKPGPLYGVSSHAWPALGVAITARHQMGVA